MLSILAVQPPPMQRLADDVGLRQNANHVAVVAHDDKIGMRFGHQRGRFLHRRSHFDHGQALERARQYRLEDHRSNSCFLLVVSRPFDQDWRSHD